jgi:hypothetical protein
MPSVPKNKARPSQLEQDDKPAEVRKDETVVKQIISITMDKNGNIIGLGNDGKVYTYRNKLWIVYE